MIGGRQYTQPGHGRGFRFARSSGAPASPATKSAAREQVCAVAAFMLAAGLWPTPVRIMDAPDGRRCTETRSLWRGFAARRRVPDGRVFLTLATAGRLHLRTARSPRRRSAAQRRVPSGGQTEHLLDIYRPCRHPGPWPVVLYIHGGVSHAVQDTHWLMGWPCPPGYLAANINYGSRPAIRSRGGRRLLRSREWTTARQGLAAIRADS